MQQKILAIIFAIVLLGVFFYFISMNKQTAEILLINGTIYTLDEKNSIAESVALQDGKIVGVGTTESVMRQFRGVKVIDLNRKAVFPGLIDGHAHLLGEGSRIHNLDLLGTKSAEQVADLVAKKVSQYPAGSWIFGRGWDQNDWERKEFPTRELLDRVAPNNPVVLRRVDGHAQWVNSKVLELAGITSSTPDPDGGKIHRDAKGKPTGILVDNAADLIDKVIPPFSDDEVEQRLLSAFHECASLGLTEVHDMGVDLQTVKVMKKIIDEGKCPIRIYALINGAGPTWEYYVGHGPEIGYGDNRFTLRGIKLYMDGALGSRGAALIEDYSDDPGNRGLLVTSDSLFLTVCKQAVQAGFQVCTHAIGDRGVHTVLNNYEQILKSQSSGSSSPRWRIEHCQVVTPNDFPRFAQLGILPAMQPTHATSDMGWAEARLGPVRVQSAYAWRSMLDNGSRIIGGSDFPVESVNPLLGIYAAATRCDNEGNPPGGWYPEQRMIREEAIRCFTQWPTYGSFEEEYKGTIKVGKWADFTILSKDIMTIPAGEILTTSVEMTIVGGKIVFQSAD